MQALTLILALVTTALCYDDKYDKMDVDKILADDAMFDAYVKCMLDKGDCKVEHSGDIKEILPEVVATACGKCSAIQRSHIRKSVKTLQEKKPLEFEEFRKKYDPAGQYEENFSVFLVGTD